MRDAWFKNFEFAFPTEDEPIDDFAVIVKSPKKSGPCICKKCGEVYPYAEGPNQKDGTFKCFSCRYYG